MAEVRSCMISTRVDVPTLAWFDEMAARAGLSRSEAANLACRIWADGVARMGEEATAKRRSRDTRLRFEKCQTEACPRPRLNAGTIRLDPKPAFMLSVASGPIPSRRFENTQQHT